MRSVDIRIRHDDDFMVTQLLDIELRADGASERGDKRPNLLRAQ